ncbi:MAG: type II toxin-antitoxin system HicB family antitoxin [Alkalispirochaeta sp.]|jgi:predicted HicB family RNase H-like nuclease
MAKDVMKYKEFLGSVQYSAEDERFVGRIEEIPDLVTFEGRSVKELKQAFHDAVEEYIRLCAATDRPILKSFKGSFNIRISPELHRHAHRLALLDGISLNQLVQKALEKEVRERNPAYQTEEETTKET